MPGTERLRSALAERYVIERELGSGGMATVYLARDIKHDREVALKVLRPELSAVIGTQRFLSEVRITAKLDHPHILTLIDSGEADGILYYVLPYVRGESLRKKMEREKQLSVDDALSIIKEVASALDYAHSQGVVHRDIKPENIMLHQGEAVLADFGIALAIKEAGGNRLTETGLSLGTPLYMSPEQATGDRSINARSDVYSLAAVFYEMMAGEPPLTGPTAQAIIAKLITEAPIRLRVVRPGVSPSMEAATGKALSKVAADRFASAGQYVKALTSSESQVERTQWKSKLPWISGAMAASIVLAFAAWWMSQGWDRGKERVVSLRGRVPLTSSGRVRGSVVSGDGKVLGYVVTDCDKSGCRYGIEMQDVTSGKVSRLLKGAAGLYGLEISPDRRNVIVIGTINGVFGSFLLPVFGGSPQFITRGIAAFWAEGDSLMFASDPPAGATRWIVFAAIDGSPVDSIPVDRTDKFVTALSAIPGIKRIAYSLLKNGTVESFGVHRNGKRLWSYSS